MKPSPFTNNSREAFALVIVLGIVVLMVILIVGFLFRASTERTASGGYAASVIARQLADKAVSVVQAQINEAATRGSDVAWASQPGMARTFDTSGNLISAYKLYSAPEMISSSVSLSTDLPPPAWAASPASWVDLNAPISANGTVNYPIMDPAALQSIGAISPVEGFAITSAPGATASQPAPMPIRWLYVLQDGSMVAPNGTGNTATVAGAASGNPIVGRVAFWTDDETAKVNINTASEGSYWDLPRTHAQSNWDFAIKQPGRNEFQRYSGHPATVSLSAVFPGLAAQDIFSIIPRVVGENDNPFGTGWTSRQGTQAPTIVTNRNTQGIKSDGHRLFTSVDEMIFNPNRAPNSLLTRPLLESRRFFLTAQSRAPETNLFNLPRVAIWPIARLSASNLLTAAKTNTFDRTIALVASTGTIGTPSFKPYFFQRENPLSPTNDVGIPRNAELISYLRELTENPIPGFGGNFQAKYGDDRDQILTEIFDYVRSSNLYDGSLNNGTLPTLGSDGKFGVYYQFTPPSVNWYASSLIKPHITPGGHGLVAPSHGPNGSMGLGRFYTLSELAMVFICNADQANTDSTQTTTDIANGKYANKMLNEPFPAGTPVTLAAGQKRVQALILPELFCVAPGWRFLTGDMRIRIRNLNTLKIDGVSLGLPADATMTYMYDPRYISGGRGFGSTLIYSGVFPYKKTTDSPDAVTAPAGNNIFPFVGAPVTTTGTTMALTGGDIIVDLYAGSDLNDTSPPVQTINITIPGGTLPVPSLVTSGSNPKNQWAWNSTGFNSAYPGRINKQTGGLTLIWDGDIVRSVLPKHGDYRLVAASKSVADDVFVKHPWYDDTSKPFASSLGNGGKVEVGDETASLISGLPFYSTSSAQKADVPSNMTQTPNATGDFDNGVTNYADGPYVNKPDEGDVPYDSGDAAPYYGIANANRQNDLTFFSPNRIMPSAGMFGSLPTGVRAGKAWQTLLFRPQSGHPGAASPKDHLWMDLFWMPVVEPYAISDRFSTSGKINLNYQILPFTYIERSTGLRAVLKNEKIWSIKDADSKKYKTGGEVDSATSGDSSITVLEPVDAAETLSQFQTKFAAGNIFISASEIADVPIVPVGATAAGMGTYWNTRRLTGDNSRERIYTNIYPQLTTKSSTYTVHFRAQALKKVPGTPADSWVEGRDAVRGEYRGSTTIERFINPNAEIPDYAANPGAISTLPTLDDFYKWRVISNKQFAP